MQTSSVKLYSLEYRQAKTYWIAALFMLGNLLLPQLCHLVPQGGMRWLPIYLFTLIGAYKYGWRVGLLTAVASPLLNSALFGMPAAAVLPVTPPHDRAKLRCGCSQPWFSLTRWSARWASGP